MVQKKFGSTQSTGHKLDIIDEYLGMYQRALGGKFHTTYIDAFAGSGEVPVGEEGRETLFDNDLETREVIVGSVARAIDVVPAFDRFVFVDKRKACIDELKLKYASRLESSDSSFLQGDANEHLQAFCRTIESQRQRCRGVVFLDPFGSQVNWDTVVAIANTRILDLWYLFPAGCSVFRQISGDGRVDATHAPSIDRIYGTPNWRTAFLEPSKQSDMFSDEQRTDKMVTPESAADFMIERMKTIFRGGVLEAKVPLGRHAYASYYLLFAWGNDSVAASNLARKLAKSAIKASDRKHGRLIRN